MPRLFLLVLLLAGACANAAAASLFDERDVLEVELRGPFHSVLRSKKDPRDFPFVLRVDGHELAVDVRLRGKSRLEHCKFPPLRLDFDPDETGQSIFEGQDELKLVTHCTNSNVGEKNLLEEYLAYRIFNLLSDYSYRVRLLHMSYVDTDGRLGRNARSRYAFVIEPTEQLAARLDSELLQLEAVSRKKLDPDQAARVYVFQYMVGNTDWSLVRPRDAEECCHNGKLVGKNGKIFYLPYDFDQSGIVNASYAKPHPVVHLRSVRDRRYRGYCTDPDILLAAIHQTNLARDEIIGLVGDAPGLTERDADKAADYLMRYFDMAVDEEKLLEKFDEHCLGR